jgi:uncharacterized protein (TIGR02391 family)
MLNWLTPDQVLRAEVDQLGVLILRFLPTQDAGWWGADNFAINYLAATRPGVPGRTTVTCPDELLRDGGAVARKLHEAWAWLDREGYLVRDPSQHGQQWRVRSQRGDELITLPAGDELKRIRAGDVLGRELHPRIEVPVRREWNAGDFETAIFKATREVEIAVRDALGDDGKGLVGMKLMNEAFGPGGKLVDPEQDPGEQEGTRSLYVGLIGVFKNPGSHRHFEPDDPVQAAGIIRTADLLLRMLDDRLAQRRQ